jgi:nitroimidazol reductase NimA-like FMN-containing flavoprotein (pyridoxamine 5'-phosphate oxidase superfamily)
VGAVTDGAPAVDHGGLVVLPFEDCLRRLRSMPVGRVAFTREGGVEVLPVNYRMVDTSVAFRTTVGAKLGAALDDQAVSFEIDEFDPVRRAGWSVVVKGRARLVVDEVTRERLAVSGLAPWAAEVPRPEWVLVYAEEITGRQTSNW